ncbi:MAG: hypothetical protein ACM3TN_16385 [Alphaproteobacteria bacterium]
MRTPCNTPRMSSTLGDLIVAVMDEALEVSKNEKRAYQITAVVLNEVLRVSLSRTDRPRTGAREKEWFH